MKKKSAYGWIGISALLLALVNLPLWFSFFGWEQGGLAKAAAVAFGTPGLNTLLLIVLVLLFSAILAIPAAYAVTAYRFPGRKLMMVLLPLSLAIPAYVNAFVYDGIFGPYGTWMSWTGSYFHVKSMLPLALIMALVLYPYLYLSVLVSLNHNIRRLGSAADLLGVQGWRKFWHLGVRSSFPAIIAGSFLIAMEVINSYGAVAYFGIDTLTTALVKGWDPTDMSFVRNLALIILVVVYAFYVAFHYKSERTTYDWRSANESSASVHTKKPTALYWCLVPVLFGVLIPVVQLFCWAIKAGNASALIQWDQIITATFSMAIVASVLVVGLLIVTHFAQLLRPYRWLNHLIGITGLGYAIPGAVIGISVLALGANVSGFSKLLAGGSIILLCYGYVIRFFATGDSGVGTVLQKFDHRLLMAAKLSGASTRKVFFSVYWKHIKRGVAVAMILVFIDVSKELPLTMLFQTFNFETLAVRAFKLMETDGAAYVAAQPALLIVVLGLVPITIMNQLIRK